MKKVIFSLLIIISLYFSFLSQLFAHLSLPDVETTLTEPTGLQFIVVNYNTPDDIIFLFENSSRVLGYFEDIEGDPPFLLALVNERQAQEIRGKGYNVQLIGENATLSDYMLLYNHSVNQSDLLKDYVDVFPLSSHYTLIRINPDQEFNPHAIPDLVEFGPVPFLEGISPPPKANVSATPGIKNKIQEQGNDIGYIIVITFILLVVLSVGSGIFVYLKRRKKQPPIDINSQIPPNSFVDQSEPHM